MIESVLNIGGAPSSVHPPPLGGPPSPGDDFAARPTSLTAGTLLCCFTQPPSHPPRVAATAMSSVSNAIRKAGPPFPSRGRRCGRLALVGILPLWHVAAASSAPWLSSSALRGQREVFRTGTPTLTHSLPTRCHWSGATSGNLFGTPHPVYLNRRNVDPANQLPGSSLIPHLGQVRHLYKTSCGRVGS